MKTTLDQILQAVRGRLEITKAEIVFDDLADRARSVRAASSPNRLRKGLAVANRLNVIAEFKRASPSRGLINDGIEPEEIGRMYERGGASAISVLTEPDFFQGSIDDLRRVRKSVELPILRKDFIVDEFQIYEAAAAGADAILLIVAALSTPDLSRLRDVATGLGLDSIVEVHSQDEMAIANEIGADLIGVNNRDLRTFAVSLDVSRDLIEFAPAGALLIAESGLTCRGDLMELKTLGYSAFLIGETLMRSGDPEASLRELLAEPVV